MTTAVADRNRRQTKLDRLRASGIDPFPNPSGTRRSLIAEVLAGVTTTPVTLSGRIVARRRRGKATFLELRDRSGTIALRLDDSSSSDERATARDAPDPGEVAHDNWDLGDIVEVRGRLGHGRQGPGVEVETIRLLAKALQIHHGLSQPTHRTQRAELLLMESEAHRERLRRRSQILTAIRAWMAQNEFIEIETPILLSHQEDGSVRGFHTRHRALDCEMTLRSASQLHLRRCIVGDVERVYELGRCFRNEGITRRHSPEFTALEWSMAYSWYRDSAAMVAGLVRHAASAVLGTTQIAFRGHRIDLELPWRSLTLREAIQVHTGLDICASSEGTVCYAREHGKAVTSWSEAVHAIYTTYIEPLLVEPTIVYDFPLDSNPCAKPHPEAPQLAQCFDVVIGGLEIASGGSEISDPCEQRSRFASFDLTRPTTYRPSSVERDYLDSLTFGAPPSSGTGVGVDRLLMVLLEGDAIDDVILFSGAGRRHGGLR